MSRSFAGLYFTRRNHIESRFSHAIVEFPFFKLFKPSDPSFRGAAEAHF